MPCNQPLPNVTATEYGHSATAAVHNAKASALGSANEMCFGGACGGLNQQCGYALDSWPSVVVEPTGGAYKATATAAGHCECQQMAAGT